MALARPRPSGQAPFAGRIDSNNRSLEGPAPCEDGCGVAAGKLLEELSLAKRDRVKPLLQSPDIDADYSGSR